MFFPGRCPGLVCGCPIRGDKGKWRNTKTRQRGLPQVLAAEWSCPGLVCGCPIRGDKGKWRNTKTRQRGLPQVLAAEWIDPRWRAGASGWYRIVVCSKSLSTSSSDRRLVCHDPERTKVAIEPLVSTVNGGGPAARSHPRPNPTARSCSKEGSAALLCRFQARSARFGLVPP
jgi:hypothetical protein